jgi:5'-nucleotidase
MQEVRGSSPLSSTLLTNPNSPLPPERVLILTNDDGVDAPGLRALYNAAEGLGQRRVIAPERTCSGLGHAVTTRESFREVARADGWIAVEGTPADCVRVGLHHLAPDASWVLAGINAGGNLGADVFHSGTAAAAREAALHGRAAIAISHYIARGLVIDWTQAARWTSVVLRELLAKSCEPGTFWNVNLPHLPPGQPEPKSVACPLDPSPLPLEFRVEGDRATYTGDYQSRARLVGADIAVCFEGQIALTKVRLFPLVESPGALA